LRAFLFGAGICLAALFAPGSPAAEAAELPAGILQAVAPAPRDTGPTLHLDYHSNETVSNMVTDFMYFVPLISTEPVSVINSPGNTQRFRQLSATRHVTAKSFSLTCEFEFLGDGSQLSVLDPGDKLRRRRKELKDGSVMEKQLGSIEVEGPGHLIVEVTGTISDQAPTVTEVQLHFNGGGKQSPVTVGIHDLRYQDGDFRTENEIVARVNTLTFKRKTSPPKMEISVASVKKKDAGNNLWQNFKGGVKGVAANLFLKPATIEPIGAQAMFDFGLALETGAHSFTFPRAKNLKTDTDLAR
jgi:hypothetical protein